MTFGEWFNANLKLMYDTRDIAGMEKAWKAGHQKGQSSMRERAAKECEVKVYTIYKGRKHETILMPDQAAKRIRDLTIE